MLHTHTHTKWERSMCVSFDKCNLYVEIALSCYCNKDHISFPDDAMSLVLSFFGRLCHFFWHFHVYTTSHAYSIVAISHKAQACPLL